MRAFTRSFDCPCCGGRTRFPRAWLIGVEVVFPCEKCGRKLKTGYKAGAALFALGLVLALATANLAVWLFSSVFLPFAVGLVIPLWLWYGVLLRKWWLVRKYRRAGNRNGTKKTD